MPCRCCMASRRRVLRLRMVSSHISVFFERDLAQTLSLLQWFRNRIVISESMYVLRFGFKTRRSNSIVCECHCLSAVFSRLGHHGDFFKYEDAHTHTLFMMHTFVSIPARTSGEKHNIYSDVTTHSRHVPIMESSCLQHFSGSDRKCRN